MTRRLIVAFAAALLGLVAPASVHAEQPDRDLEQTIRPGQKIASDRAVLADGHVDVGPLFVDGMWRLMIHDDQAKAGTGESVWRHPGRTVLRVTDDARLTVPDDPTYGFLPADPGDQVLVIPQTQDPDVVWVGWNTQDPDVMETIDRGITMHLAGVQGPGELVVFLQSGDLTEPQVLWDSRRPTKRVWVDVNTHTHANWVFSEPGVYLVRITIVADLIDGATVADTRDLRFAVGPGTTAKEAFAAAWRGTPRAPVPAIAQPPAPREEPGGAGLGVAAIAAAALALAAAAAAVVVRGRRAKRRART